MTLPMILLIVIIFIAIVLFALDVVPADVIGIGIMVWARIDDYRKGLR